MMTKKQAKALIRARDRICAEIDRLLETLDARERNWADAYYAGNIKNLISGVGYGSAPAGKALDVLGDDA